MPLPGNHTPARIQKQIFLAVLITLAVVINTLENTIPNPLPWVRLGLSNFVTLLVLSIYGFREALLVTIMKVVLASLLSGGFLGPGFILSLGGSLASLATMGLLLPTGLFSAIGISASGSFIHTLTQFVILFILIVGDSSILDLATPFLILSLPAGVFIGWLAMKSEEALSSSGRNWGM